MTKRKNVGAARSPDGLGIFKDHETDWVLKRTLEMMSEKAAEIGECLYAAGRIDECKTESWISEWAALAGRVEAQAKGSLQAGNLASARDAFLRASNYYRTAEYGTPPAHPRFHELWQKSVDCFQQACPLFDPPVQTLSIPFEGFLLPGYFWPAAADAQSRPTFMAVGGNDSSGEEIFFVTANTAHRQGYNYFTFEYPGHRGAVHLDPACIKRPDYEVPFKMAIDYLQTLPGVDERLALSGFSFGGYVAARVAAFEPRIQAVIPDSPIVDMQSVMAAVWEPVLNQTRWLPKSLRNALVRRNLERSPMRKSLVEYSLWTNGVKDKTILEWVEAGGGKPFTMREYLPQINCPALAMVSQDEGEVMVRQAYEFYENISSKHKQMHIFTRGQDGSNDHCQLDNISRGQQVAFDWLQGVFN